MKEEKEAGQNQEEEEKELKDKEEGKQRQTDRRTYAWLNLETTDARDIETK